MFNSDGSGNVEYRLWLNIFLRITSTIMLETCTRDIYDYQGHCDKQHNKRLFYPLLLL